MNKIYKYSLPVQEKYEIELPVDSSIIRVGDVMSNTFKGIKGEQRI